MRLNYILLHPESSRIINFKSAANITVNNDTFKISDITPILVHSCKI